MVKKYALLFSFYGFVICTMDGPSQKKPKIEKSIFDCQEYCNNGIPLTTVMPKSLIITPDKKGVVMARKGEVLWFPFVDPKSLLSNMVCHSIIKHSHSSYSPMIVVAQTEHDPLIVVSGINCKGRDTGKNISEYIWYSNGLCKVKKLNMPTQAIALDESGKILVVAGGNKIAAIDFMGDKQYEIFIPELKKDDFFVDIAVNLKTDIPIVAVDNHGEIRSLKLESLNNFFKLFRLSSIKTEDNIKKLSYVTAAQLLYLTRDNAIKSIDAYGLIGEQAEKKCVACVQPYDTVFFDRDSRFVYLFCNKKTDSSVYEIQICRQKGEFQEKFILEALLAGETYTHIKDGKINIGENGISLVTIQDDIVVALAKNGMIYKWDLKEQNHLVTQSQATSRQLRRRSSSYSGEDLAWLKKEQKHLERVTEHVEESAIERSFVEDAVLRTNSVPGVTKRKSNSLPESGGKIHRARSVSTAPPASGSKRALSPRDSGSDQRQQKTSPRIDVLKKSSGSLKSSRENSPGRSSKSRSNSPSPRSCSNSTVDKSS
jgi:hypothetical protein